MYQNQDSQWIITLISLLINQGIFLKIDMFLNTTCGSLFAMYLVADQIVQNGFDTNFFLKSSEKNIIF